MVAWETQLSTHHFKTVALVALLRVRVHPRQAGRGVVAKVAMLYQECFFRKNRLNAYLDKGRSEGKMTDWKQPSAGLIRG